MGGRGGRGLRGGLNGRQGTQRRLEWEAGDSEEAGMGGLPSAIVWNASHSLECNFFQLLRTTIFSFLFIFPYS